MGGSLPSVTAHSNLRTVLPQVNLKSIPGFLKFLLSGLLPRGVGVWMGTLKKYTGSTQQPLKHWRPHSSPSRCLSKLKCPDSSINPHMRALYSLCGLDSPPWACPTNLPWGAMSVALLGGNDKNPTEFGLRKRNLTGPWKQRASEESSRRRWT